MAITFSLPHWVNPKNPDDVLFIANRIAAIRHGDQHLKTPPTTDGSMVNINPGTNDHWIVPPKTGPNDSDEWTMTARYDDDNTLSAIVALLKKFI